ncbi:cytochrome P450 87A3 [Zea mays]|uniref:Cytochrome P450 family 87 subfamily A polypeptide 2 n=1 Tax=Zea mays TaxID=4577 RepID=A0A1D6GL62_MAIZE|nr:cytochrome P450 87A3 [Zea mays]AQK64054.1 cytochrome P450 family 87 subfamily A polypeptide 2 [Zea mays]|eukprot:XP_008644631.1 cytochrome P450 87A3 [Zea mays]
MSMHYLAALSAVALGAILLLRSAFKWMNGARTGKDEGRMLPPGSRGLPLLGETLEFFAASPTLELVPFFKRRLERFGPIFRTNIVGEDLIVSLDPELNARVLQQEERGFQIWYPSSFMRVFGDDNIISALGPLHRHIRNLVLRLFGPEALRLVLLRDVQRSARDELRSWLDHPDVEVRTATSRMIFAVTAKKLISHDDAASGGSLWKCFDAWTKGLLSFPLCVPGTAFYKCMQGRKNVMKILKQQLDERRNTAERRTVDFFDLVIDELNKPDPIMNENIALDLLFLLLFASHETTSMGLTAILKFLTDNPKALQELTEEHEKIVETRVDPDSDITWEEYKSMRFTSHVIHESLRLANIAPVVFRQANQDVYIKGYTIPEGSKIMICPSAAHLNSKVYEDPTAFNPWRWKDTPEPVGGSKDFMAFGGGLRLCVGADFAKLQMAMFIHCLVTKYSWKPISKGTMVFYPGLRFPEGFHIQLLAKA